MGARRERRASTQAACCAHCAQFGVSISARNSMQTCFEVANDRRSGRCLPGVEMKRVGSEEGDTADAGEYAWVVQRVKATMDAWNH
ncbi:hypothetical protein FIBSPDRAFT_874539 [Athelia psychrophila]|uniref:Uncharacterized protein n=1 Tax=Athelia psychrophila TaxID=1759441 RepID=A0A165XFW2_9AGAM|nr:hypothetical protein FIBSPDRAFT_874539 [Fibularhizoctonia sp. CBS 109695]